MSGRLGEKVCRADDPWGEQCGKGAVEVVELLGEEVPMCKEHLSAYKKSQLS